MGRVVWLDDPSTRAGSGMKGDDWRKPEDGSLFRAVRMAEGWTAEGFRTAGTLAYPERPLPDGGLPAYREARKQGVRTLVLWADPRRERQLATLATRTAAKGGPATYEVLDEAGAPLAVIIHEPAARDGRVRARWTVRQTDGPRAVGH